MQCPLDIANNTDCLKVIAFTHSKIDGASKNNFECMDLSTTNSRLYKTERFAQHLWPLHFLQH